MFSESVSLLVCDAFSTKHAPLSYSLSSIRALRQDQAISSPRSFAWFVSRPFHSAIAITADPPSFRGGVSSPLNDSLLPLFV
ncbi:hypothetical protein BDN71DRAFT_1454797 [Pleurotus eryngii]|uniref:Uncharacterized protein n=1 Tax=Pleurotus eryngii TaxID=5323 RepID=A0A9P5ZP94_PLEER|nr:hypothetical protein BDN71DRAFT_1454797 [Pleurotus eryngii]